MVALSFLVRQRRAELGLSQEALARRCELSWATIQNIEVRRTIQPNPVTLAKLEKALEWPYGTLSARQSNGSAANDSGRSSIPDHQPIHTSSNAGQSDSNQRSTAGLAPDAHKPEKA